MKTLIPQQMRWMGLAALILSAIASPTLACDDGPGGRRGPPTEALNACSGAAENQACQFEAPHGTVTGTCRNIQNQLACVPAGGPGGPRAGAQGPQGA